MIIWYKLFRNRFQDTLHKFFNDLACIFHCPIILLGTLLTNRSIPNLDKPEMTNNNKQNTNKFENFKNSKFKRKTDKIYF